MIEKIKFNKNDTVYDCELDYEINVGANASRLHIKFVDLVSTDDDGNEIIKEIPTTEQFASGYLSINEFTGEVQGGNNSYKYIYRKISDIEFILTNNALDLYTEDSANNENSEKVYTDEELVYILSMMKANKIKESKELLSSYLETNPLISSCHNGVEGRYSVTLEKQSLMVSQYMAYQIEKAINPFAKITWNESGKSCEEWTEEEFLQLILEVKNYVYPLVAAQQKYEEDINNCTTIDELNDINIVYCISIPEITEEEVEEDNTTTDADDLTNATEEKEVEEDTTINTDSSAGIVEE